MENCFLALPTSIESLASFRHRYRGHKRSPHQLSVHTNRQSVSYRSRTKQLSPSQRATTHNQPKQAQPSTMVSLHDHQAGREGNGLHCNDHSRIDVVSFPIMDNERERMYIDNASPRSSKRVSAPKDRRHDDDEEWSHGFSWRIVHGRTSSLTHTHLHTCSRPSSYLMITQYLRCSFHCVHPTV